MSLLKSTLTRALLLAITTFAAPFAARAQNDSPGTVYTLSNATAGNRVLAFARAANGDLAAAGSYATGGTGTGASLGSQGALALSDDGRWLLAVNAGSNQLSVFAVHNDTLVLSDVVGSGGTRPVSVTIAANLVYVLNAGGVENISGFYLTEQGELLPLSGSTRPLSGAGVAPAQVSFGRHGDVLVVTERASNRIDGFAVDSDGRAGALHSVPSSGAVPFGFAISSKGYAFVSEAPGSALSSYRLASDGTVELVAASVANQQAAACWVALSKNEKYAYTANAANNTISAYAIGDDGSVELIGNGVAAVADDGPLDLAGSNNGRYLYALHARSRSIVAFRVGEDGSLTRVDDIGGLPTGVAGLVAR